MEYEHILTRLSLRARETPDRRLFTIVDDRGQDKAGLTTGQLLTSATSIAGYLGHELGFQSRERIILCYPPSLDFVSALFGCLLSGCIPVPVAPPNPLKDGYDRRTFAAIVESSGAAAVLTNGEYDRVKNLASLRQLFRRDKGWPDLPWYRSDRLPSREYQAPEGLPPGADDLALLQYTSGSTAAPKGVMITYGNIAHQLWLNHTELGINETSRGVFWVPHFHDFGLISGILSAVYNNMAISMMSPLDYLRRPALWLEVMSRVKATHTAAPDFGFRLAVNKSTAEQRRSWDLSTLQVVMSAAEPIRPSTVDAFKSAFSASKLDPDAFCPAYGLAEHTVGVSVFGRKRAHLNRARLEKDRQIAFLEPDDPAALTLIGCGSPSAGVDLRLVDPGSGREVEPGRAGEIWVDSPSKAAGYYNLPELSREQFQASLTGDEGRGAFLRTGDLGFMANGELYIAGRLKDMINAYGRNIYPQDLEEVATAAHPAIRPGRTVAFSIPAAGSPATSPPTGPALEEIAVLVEVNKKRLPAEELKEISRAVRGQILAQHQLPLREVIVAGRGTVMKTTSGKLRRQAHRQAFLDGSLAKQTLLIDHVDEISEAGTGEALLQIEPARRVAVIGGGVSGLTAAYELQRLGHQVTVFEREPQVGGKVTAVQVGDHHYDLGGALVTDRYYGLRQIAREIGAGFYFSEPLKQVDKANQPLPPPDPDMSDPEFRQNYVRARDEIFPHILQAGIVHQSANLATSTGVWLRQEGLETIAAMDAGLIYTAFGYGHLASPDIPVAYFLKYVETTGSPATGGAGRSSFVAGSMADLWGRLADHLHDVRCNAEVTQVIRSDRSVQVISNGESFTFDNLILAMPFENTSPFLDTSDEEAALFSRIRTLDYYSTLCSVDGLCQGEGILVRQHCLDPEMAGHVLFGGGQYPETDVFLFGAYGAAKLSGDDIIDFLREDLAQMDARLTAVHAQRHWRYMPHVSESDFRDGYYRRFESMQGQNQTFYVGSLLNMETIESNVAYAYELVRRNFLPAGYDFDRRAPYLQLGVPLQTASAVDATGIRDWLIERLAFELGLSPAQIDPAVPISDYALDSLRAIQLVGQMETDLGITVPQDILLRDSAIDELAAELMRLEEAPGSQPSSPITSTTPEDEAALEWEEGTL